MKDKKSVLEAIMNDVFVAGSFEDAMNILNTRLDEPNSPIRDSDKHMIKVKANQCQSLIKLQQYLANSYLRFSGMGI